MVEKVESNLSDIVEIGGISTDQSFFYLAYPSPLLEDAYVIFTYLFMLIKELLCH
jgi:hypothetical protein